MKKTMAIVVLAMTMLLLGQMACQIYATPKPAESSMQTRVLVKTPYLEITEAKLFDGFTFDIGNGEVWVQRNLTFYRTDRLQDSIWYTQIRATGYILVDGEEIPINFHTNRYPLHKIYEAYGSTSESTSYTATSYATTSSLPTYLWDGLVFVKHPGSDRFYIEYDKPHNVPGENPVYNIPPNEGTSSALHGDDRYHGHIPIWIIQDMIQGGTMTSLGGAIGALIVLLLAIPEVISKVIAAFLAIIPAVLSVIGLCIRVFAETVMKTELGDGWQWLWGIGRWWIFLWWHMSFGKLRDWNFFFIFPVFGDSGEGHMGGGPAGGCGDHAVQPWFAVHT